MRILIIDDEIVVAKMLGRLLRHEAPTVELDARAAVDRIVHGETFDVVICDVMMPGYDGRELVAQMRATVARRGGEPPAFVLMSGYDDLGNIPPGVTLLVKPFSAAVLHATLAKLVPQRRAG